MIAAIYREHFGQGTNDLVATESIFVVFLLGLICGVLLMGAFFIWNARRECRRRKLPLETEELFRELRDDNRAQNDPPAEQEPWSRGPDWWKE